MTAQPALAQAHAGGGLSATAQGCVRLGGQQGQGEDEGVGHDHTVVVEAITVPVGNVFGLAFPAFQPVPPPRLPSYPLTPI